MRQRTPEELSAIGTAIYRQVKDKEKARAWLRLLSREAPPGTSPALAERMNQAPSPAKPCERSHREMFK